MTNENISLLPQMGKLNMWLKKAEKELQKEFGRQFKLSISGIGNTFSIDAIVKIVSDKLSIPINKVLGKERFAQEVEARQIAMFLCKTYLPDATLVEIGGFFDKDHSTVINAIERIENMLATQDRSIVEKVNLCKQEFEDRIKINL